MASHPVPRRRTRRDELTIRAGPTGARLPPRAEARGGPGGHHPTGGGRDRQRRQHHAVGRRGCGWRDSPRRGPRAPGGGPPDGWLPDGGGADHRRLRAPRALRDPHRGAVWSGGRRGEPELLRGCYEHALRLAREHGLASVAFPSISTGAYRYPIEHAAGLAVETVRRALREPGPVELVRFVCFSAGDLGVYRRLLGA